MIGVCYWQTVQWLQLLPAIIAIVNVILVQNVQSFLFAATEQASAVNFIEPLNNAGLLVNQLLEDNSNVTSLLDQTIGHTFKPPKDYPSLEKRSDIGDYLEHYDIPQVRENLIVDRRKLLEM